MPIDWKMNVVVPIFKEKGDKLRNLQRSEVTGVCHEDCGKGDREKKTNNGKFG